MDICLLSKREVGRLIHYGIEPVHEDHIHISVETAISGLKDATYRTAGVLSVTEAESNEYVWKKRDSDGAKVRQMVPA